MFILVWHPLNAINESIQGKLNFIWLFLGCLGDRNEIYNSCYYLQNTLVLNYQKNKNQSHRQYRVGQLVYYNILL